MQGRKAGNAMELWIWVTIAAAAVQTVRFMLQKRMRGLGLSTTGATFARFVFAAPLAGAGVGALWLAGLPAPPVPGAGFWGFAVGGGIAQIIATFCTVALFSTRSFAVGIAFTKSEVVLVALFSAVLLGEAISWAGAGAIALGTLGVVLLSTPEGGWRQMPLDRRALALGLMAGGFFALSAIGYRGATLAVEHPAPAMRALVALTAATTFQTLAMAAWMGWRDRAELVRVARLWRAVLPVGVTGMLGSAGWFVAFSMQNAAYVRSVGQIELMFSVLASVLVFASGCAGSSWRGWRFWAPRWWRWR